MTGRLPRGGLAARSGVEAAYLDRLVALGILWAADDGSFAGSAQRCGRRRCPAAWRDLPLARRGRPPGHPTSRPTAPSTACTRSHPRNGDPGPNDVGANQKRSAAARTLGA
jgi:hypothetical protein